MVDHRHVGPVDPADRADLAGDACGGPTGQDRTTERSDARKICRGGRSAAARELTTSERSELPPAVGDWFARGLAAAPAPAGDAGGRRARAQVRCWSRRPARARRWPGSCRRSATCRSGRRKGCTRSTFAAESARGRRPAQPHRPDRGDGPADPRRDTHRRHALRPQGAAADEAAANTSDHAGVAEPAAELPGLAADVREARRRSSSTSFTASPRRSAATCFAVDVAAAGARARAAPGRAVRDDQRPRRLSRPGSRPTRTWSWSTSSSAIPARSPTSRS